MKRIFLWAMAALLVSCSAGKTTENGQNEQYEYGPYTVNRIALRADGAELWHLRDCNSSFPAGPSLDSLGQPRYNNCSDMYLAIGKEKALLIDLSNAIQWNDSAAESLRHIIAERIGKRELLISFTHNHGDHVGMLPAYLGKEGVLFMLPKNDFGGLVEHFSGSNYQMIGEGYVFDLGNLTINTIEVSGHTAGSFVFDVKGEHILLTGDAVGSGHGVWIFNKEGFCNYSQGVPHLMAYVRDPKNGIDTTKLTLYGGHYHQKEWLMEGKNFPDSLPLLTADEELHWTYLTDMEAALQEAQAGTARTEPFEITFGEMDTYFIHGSASIVAPKAAVTVGCE